MHTRSTKGFAVLLELGQKEPFSFVVSLSVIDRIYGRLTWCILCLGVQCIVSFVVEHLIYLRTFVQFWSIQTNFPKEKFTLKFSSKWVLLGSDSAIQWKVQKPDISERWRGKLWARRELRIIMGDMHSV